jgi:hypothetical protein
MIGAAVTMSRVLLRFLLLAVFFNTVVGMPIHESRHLRDSGIAAAAVERAHAAAPQDDEELHGLCAWCQAYAQQAGTLPAAGWQAHVPPAAIDLRLRAGTARTAPATDPPRWRFAARAPPHSI